MSDPTPQTERERELAIQRDSANAANASLAQQAFAANEALAALQLNYNQLKALLSRWQDPAPGVCGKCGTDSAAVERLKAELDAVRVNNAQLSVHHPLAAAGRKEMSEKQKFPFADAWLVANQLVGILQPFCEQIEIAGSLRRYKPEVGDIEILFRSKIAQRPLDLISTEDYNECWQKVDQLEAAGVLEKRGSKTAIFTWGNLNRLAIDVSSGIPVDLFSEPSADDWIRSLVIRTGGKQTNIRLIESAAKRGVRIHAYGVGLTRMTTGERIPCASEREFFEICGVPYLEPEKRV